ncbi:hypothetical protein GGX14DRAFT_388522 [Mycena pura]|uniref:Uncharacterized protein n=1 Tax=Mycena pura TaxID=153505 RepID=A0AAD6VX68_9AGAR|nr:hypothetical protein GGX14DRAFT_388522 [Mycena pura]
MTVRKLQETQELDEARCPRYMLPTSVPVGSLLASDPDLQRLSVSYQRPRCPRRCLGNPDVPVIRATNVIEGFCEIVVQLPAKTGVFCTDHTRLRRVEKIRGRAVHKKKQPNSRGKDQTRSVGPQRTCYLNVWVTETAAPQDLKVCAHATREQDAVHESTVHRRARDQHPCR